MAYLVKLDRAGRFTVPKELRQRLHLVEGVEAVARIEGGELRLSTRAAALERAQAALSSLKRPAGGDVDEFLADRRKEAERE